MSRPRILFVCSGLTVGGAERQWSILIPRVEERGFDVSVLTLVAEGVFFDELRAKGIPIECAGMRRRTDVGALRRALAYARPRPDLVVTSSINAHVVGQVVARLARAPHLTTEHFNVGVGHRTRRHQRVLARLVGPGVDLAIAVADEQLPYLLARGCRRERIRVIRNGVPDVIARRPRASIRADLGLDDDDFLAVLAATLRPEKRPQVFVEAVLGARAVDARVTGLVVGDGPELDRLRAETPQDAGVRLLGQRQDVLEILDAADVVCLSSHAEGVPMVLLEAMSLGKPIVATDVGGVAQAVEHGRTGLLVASGNVDGFRDALLQLAGNPALREELGSGAKSRHNTLFSVDRMIDEYVDAFLETIASRDPRRPDPAAVPG